MLPLHAAESEKMNRHGYGGANGHAGSGGYPLSPTFVESRGRSFNIRPDKYEKCVHLLLTGRVHCGSGSWKETSRQRTC